MANTLTHADTAPPRALDSLAAHGGEAADALAPTRRRRPALKWHIGAPVLVAGLATLFLFASLDRSQPLTFAAGTLGVALLGAVLSRQLGKILNLERQVRREEERLTTVSDIVSNLNVAPALGGQLGPALEQMERVLESDASGLWLPDPRAEGRLILVEHRGLDDSSARDALLAELRNTFQKEQRRATTLATELPGFPGSRLCLAARLGHDTEELGYLVFLRCRGNFTAADAAMVGAVASDVGTGVRSVRLVSEARRLADRDPVTGLHGHRAIYQRLHAELNRHMAAERPLAVLMMDLENFKLYNDTYGHAAGDEVLKRVSGVLRRTCREQDILGRYGGDEFVVILTDMNQKAAIRCAEKIQAALAREKFRCQDSDPLPIGFSYGVAVFPDNAGDVQKLVSVADTNLFRARCQGGNCIVAGVATASSLSVLHSRGLDLFQAMVTAVDNKDGYTRRHSEEVTEYSLQLAGVLQLDDEMLKTIQVSGLLHDVGKIGVPDEILRKPGRLTDEEFRIMAQHPVFGAVLVGSMPGMDEVILGVRHHHERWDGRGYPDKLSGVNIPLIGRMMAVADAFSAMTTCRPYRKGMTEKQALAEIQRGLGSQFDPELGALFIQLRQKQSETAPPPSLRRRRNDAAPAGDSAVVSSTPG